MLTFNIDYMKLFKIIMLVLVAMAANTAIAQTYDVTFGKNEVYRTIYTTEIDTVNGNLDAVEKVFKVNKGYKYNYQMQMAADTTAAGDSCVFALMGSVDGTNYFSISANSWYMSADTTLMVNSSAKVSWRFIKVKLTSYGSAARAALGRSHLSIFTD